MKEFQIKEGGAVWIKPIGRKGIVKYLEEEKVVVTYFDKSNKRHIKYFTKDQLDVFIPKKLKIDDSTVYFSKLRPSAKIPSKREGDGCYDVYADFEEEELKIEKGKTVFVSTGIASAFSSKYRMNCARERGSTGALGLQVLSGQIDSGYTGEWFIVLHNSSDSDIIISKDALEVEHIWCRNICYYPYTKAICQCALEIVPQVEIKEVPYSLIEGRETDRGKGALGSSGK